MAETYAAHTVSRQWLHSLSPIWFQLARKGHWLLIPPLARVFVGEFPRKLGLLQDNGEKPCVGRARAAGNTPSTQVVKSFSSYTIARQVLNSGFSSAAAAHCARTLFYSRGLVDISAKGRYSQARHLGVFGFMHVVR